MRDISKLAASLRTESDDLIMKADPHVAAVLRAASQNGVHIASIKHLLKEIGYEDEELVQDLLKGFKLIGEIPIASDT